MHILGFLWDYGLPVLVIAGAVMLVVQAVTATDDAAPVGWPYGLLMLIAGLDALFGENRPPFERAWKGAAAALGVVALVVYLCKRYRREPVAAPVHAAAGGGVPVVVELPDSDERPGATVTRWLKHVGDRVEAGEPVAEVALEKVEFELPASASGVLRRIDVAEGQTAPPGTVLAVIEP
jgi:peptidoglycan/LPS O-acetylase OafA/YrhL